MKPREKVICPYCGYKMPIEREKNAVCSGLWVKCKGRNCAREFEIKINNKSDK